MSTAESALIRELKQQISGAVVAPSDDAYNKQRQPWLQVVEQQPVAIVNALSVEDISNAVRFAASKGLPLGVQNTGHGIIRACDGGILLRLAEMKDVSIDAETQTAIVEPGVDSGELLAAAEPHGLVYPAGQVSNVGVIGYTLGGGLGWLSRKLGAACRSALAATVVLADGSVVKASEDENADLFWAIRGGGGNFGVISSLTVKLYPISEIFGGVLYFRINDATQVLKSFRDWTAGLGENTCATLRLMKLPPQPRFLLHALTETCAITVCHADSTTAEKLQDELRTFGEPVIGDLKARPYREMAQYDQASDSDGSATISHVECIRGLSDDFLHKLFATASENIPPIMQFELQQLGGKFSEQDAGVAFLPPQASFLLHLVSPTMGKSLPELELATKDATDALAPAFTGESLYNFLRADQQSRTANVFGSERFRRLQTIKQRYDPDNLFQLNLNIPPA